MMSDSTSSTCRDAFDEESIAALVGLELDEREAEPVHRHLAACRACASVYLAHLLVQWAIADLQEGAPEVGRSGHLRTRSRVLATRLRRLPVAAALLLTLGVAAAATVVLLRRPVFVPTADVGEGRVAELELRTGLDFASAGAEPGAVVRATRSFVGADGSLATVAVVESSVDGRLDVIGFDTDGRAAWSAQRGWEDWEETLGHELVRFRGLVSLVTRRAGLETSETLCLITERRHVGCAMTIDPGTGLRLGEMYHRGPLAPDMGTRESVAVLPSQAGLDRRILICGQHREAETVRPCVSVMELDGSLARHLTFPSLDLAGFEGPWVREVRIDWSAGHEGVRIDTSDELLFSIPLADGRLNVGAATCAVPDHFERAYEAKFGPGSLSGFLAQEGGRDAFERRLAQEIRGDDLAPPTGWRSR